MPSMPAPSPSSSARTRRPAPTPSPSRGLGSNGTEKLCRAGLLVVGGGAWVAERAEFAAGDGFRQGEGVAAEHVDVLEAERGEAGDVLAAHVVALGAEAVDHDHVVLAHRVEKPRKFRPIAPDAGPALLVEAAAAG